MPDTKQAYSKQLKEFTKQAKRAFETSIEAKDIDAGAQRYWASVLLVRISCLCASVLQICPRSVLNERGLNWDAQGVCSLCRTIFEAVLVLHYVLEEVPEEEWEARITLIHLADCTERIRFFSQHGDHNNVASFVVAAVGLRERLQSNSFFQLLPEKKRKQLLNGETPCFLSKTQIISSLGRDPDPVLYSYRWLSNHTHTFPFGFHRTREHHRDGTENEVDRSYFAVALELASGWMSFAIDRFQAAFADLAIFGTHSFDFKVLMSGGTELSPRDEALIVRTFGPNKLPRV
ncbi:MAG: DUF5677 domain-containing protein [Acidobacteriota bacterium]